MRIIISESQLRLIVENEEYINSIMDLINTFDIDNIEIAFQIMKGMKIKQSVILDEYKELFDIFKLKPSKSNLIEIANSREVKVSSSYGDYRESVPDILFKMPKLEKLQMFVKNLDNLKSFDGKMYIDIPSLLGEIGNQGSIPNLTHIGKDLHIFGEVDTLPKLESVGGNLSLSFSKISSLPELEYVGNNLIIIRRRIESLPKLKYVGDTLILEGSEISSLPKDLYVGGGLNLKNTPLSKTTTEEELRKQINVKGNILL